MIKSESIITNQFQSDIDHVKSNKACLIIEQAAIEHNLKLIQASAKSSRIMAVLKGNAYGVGAAEVLPIVDPYADAFAVDNLAQAIELRQLGIQKKILVFEGGIRNCLDLCLRYEITPGITDIDQLVAFNELAKNQSKKVPVWILTNVGFNRSGYRDQNEFLAFIKKANKCEYLKIETIYAHLTNAHSDRLTSISQIDSFFERVDHSQNILDRTVSTSLFASHSILRWGNEYSTDWIRPGIIMYGEHIYDHESLGSEEIAYSKKLHPALKLQARIMSLIDIPSNQFLGYNQVVAVNKETRLANVGIGFGSGVPIGNFQIPVLVNGQQTYTKGQAGMDNIQIDVTQIRDATQLDWVTFFGKQDDNFLPLNEFLKKMNKSPYEFLTNLKITKKVY